MILALQGGMAVGKTTAARYVARHAPEVTVFFENNDEVIAQVRRRGLVKTHYPDYLEIQRLWLDHAVRRYQAAAACPHALLDYGPEEILFYTLHYPASAGHPDWDVAGPLARELEAARQCMPHRILFLDAADPQLCRRKEGDTARDRGFFDHTLTHLLPAKRAWFAALDRVDWLDTTALSPDQTGAAVLAWVQGCLAAEE